MSRSSVVAVGAFVVGALVGFPSLGLAKDTKAKMPNLVNVCSKECPDAKTNEAVLECAEMKEKDPTFKKSKCGTEHAKYEKMAGGHHDEHSHAEGEEKH